MTFDNIYIVLGSLALLYCALALLDLGTLATRWGGRVLMLALALIVLNAAGYGFGRGVMLW